MIDMLKASEDLARRIDQALAVEADYWMGVLAPEVAATMGLMVEQADRRHTVYIVIGPDGSEVALSRVDLVVTGPDCAKIKTKRGVDL